MRQPIETTSPDAVLVPESTEPSGFGLYVSPGSVENSDVGSGRLVVSRPRQRTSFSSIVTITAESVWSSSRFERLAVSPRRIRHCEHDARFRSCRRVGFVVDDFTSWPTMDR